MNRRVTQRGEAKADDCWSRSESESEEGEMELRWVDPKPRELPMGRVKRG